MTETPLLCPTCGATYRGPERFCMADGTPLTGPMQALETAPLMRIEATHKVGAARDADTTAKIHREALETLPCERLDPMDVTAIFGRQEHPTDAAEYLRRQLQEQWLELQECWLRLSGLMIAAPCPDPVAIAQEREALGGLLDEFTEEAEQLYRMLQSAGGGAAESSTGRQR